MGGYIISMDGYTRVLGFFRCLLKADMWREAVGKGDSGVEVACTIA